MYFLLPNKKYITTILAAMLITHLSACKEQEKKQNAASLARFEGIEINPLSKEDALIKFKKIALVFCNDDKLRRQSVSAQKCLLQLEEATPLCESEIKLKLPERLGSARQAKEFAKQYTRCVIQ